MKKFIAIVATVLIAVPALAHAGKGAKTKAGADEYGEYTLNPNVIEQAAPIEEKNIGAADGPTLAKSSDKKAPAKKTADGDEVEVVKKSYGYSSLGPAAGGREGKFRVGFVGPGIGVANKGVGALATFGAEGEYFFFEKLSAGMRAEVATHFSNATIVSFAPRARYVFDFENWPRWAVYAQAGAGIALYNFAGSNYAAADIAVPGGGLWWQWTNKWSLGADTSLHIFIRSGATAVGFNFAPTIRYLF